MAPEITGSTKRSVIFPCYLLADSRPCAASGLRPRAGAFRRACKRSVKTPQGIPVPMSVFHMEKQTITSGNVSPDFGGSNLVGVDHLGNQFIDVLRAKLITRRLGARVISGLTGDCDIPKQSAAAGTSWIAEDAELGDGDPTFQKITL
jgi:hypothetical protein